MRPVLLEIAGFGSFRDPAAVDFTEVDYFVLVGPTGSGKSTVIDAMTFALYGSVPRWNDRRLVSLALAPTAVRGTVRLVFDAAGARYVVARELRRSASGSVTVRGARLEKLVDPGGLGAAGEATEVVAADSEVTGAVEALLGLGFEHFCSCVVLPQGDFAEFLHARPADRQRILTRLLGLGVYDEVRTAAAGRAGDRRQRAAVLDEQLAGYQDATEDAELAAGSRVDALTALTGEVDRARAELATHASAAAEATAELGRVERERDLLAAIRAPGDVVELTARLARATAAADDAAKARQEAERADTAARAAVAAAPDRAPLEQARRHHDGLATALTDLPRARATHVAARDELTRVAQAVAGARSAREAAASARDAAERTSQALADEVARLRAEHELLAAVRTPEGVVELAGKLRAARHDADRAAQRRHDAERADDDARTALAATPDRTMLQRARADHDDLTRQLVARAEAESVHTAARAARDTAAAAVETARQLRGEAARALEHARTADLAGALRPHLVAGEPCPVCEQTVVTLPTAGNRQPAGPEPTGDGRPGAPAALVMAQAALDDATSALDLANKRATEADRTELSAGLRAHQLGERVNDLQAALADAPDSAGVDAGLAEIAHREQEVARTGQELAAARRVADQAGQVVAQLAAAETQARAALTAARDPLVVLGAPVLTDEPADTGPGAGPGAGTGGNGDGGGGGGGGSDLAGSWAWLVAWAEEQATGREARLTAATVEESAARAARDDARRAYDHADAAAGQAEADQLAAVGAERDAAVGLASTERLVAELRAALAGAPPADEVTAALAELDQLDRAVTEADQGLRATRADADAAEAGLRAAQQARGDAQTVLARARDTVVALGAPTVDSQDLLAGWTTLTSWTAAESSARERELPGLRAQVSRAEQAGQAVTRALTEVLVAHGIPLPRQDNPPPQPQRQPRGGIVSDAVPRPRPGGRSVGDAAAQATSSALEQAKAELRRVTERRAKAAALSADLARAREEEQVAHQLDLLLRSNRFQRWLVAAALDTLVSDASVTLAELSGGQFELTHEQGEFLVVDHADADSRRLVRTLSGGETFQASLALALALSAQLTTMAAAGAAQLDSIFLDEGFGTLDDSTLDVVATALENLASGGTSAGRGRMVGIVTHVGALAERVPVRFAVTRDQRTSTIRREST
ncbi:exonuclease SbcC [Parafrankia irregularis]|uniref:Nuclease SbcCD subunit C n=1 Tax=Parafrankia irregularis TaxID=795642 RepID=A0A0S4QJF5_9ACTN|nr:MULTISPECIES: AAA family ATPase [Parafrankia]MBE3204185.1 SMC family ATPase [Parafrankia sp. CH37]CUU54936.1 exonuclease SbcC [Parafrankia irregularis]